MIYEVPRCVKEVVDTWRRHSFEIQKANPTWKGLYIGSGVILSTGTLTCQEVFDNWIDNGQKHSYKEVINLLEAFKDTYVPAIIIVGPYIRPIFDKDLSDFRRWLNNRFYVRPDDD